MQKTECSVAIQVLPQAEDDFDQLMHMAKECQRIGIKEDAPHVLSHIKIHYSPKSGAWSINEKVDKRNG